MKAKSALILALFFFIASKGITVQVLPYVPSFGERLAPSMNQFGSAIGQGLAARKARKREQEAKFNQIYAKVHVLLNGYVLEKHDDYMRLLASSPDLPYSLKVGLINHYNEYKKAREDLDGKYILEYYAVARNLHSNCIIQLNDLVELSVLMNPHIDQQNLKHKINTLRLEKKSKNELEGFIKKYYSERNKLDKWSCDVERSLITSLGN